MDSNFSTGNDCFHLIALRDTPGLGDALCKKLIAVFGSAEAVFNQSKKDLLSIPRVGEKTVQAIRDKAGCKKAENEVRFIQSNGIDFLTEEHKKYPERLKRCVDAPLFLFAKGNYDLNKKKVLSIVGTRNATSYGKGFVKELLEEFKRDKDLLVASGLAYGIDICAHEAAVENEIQTVAVLGHGLDQIYPSNHTSVARKMLENGALLSEFFSQTYPDRENFPKRNRIVAGMADATLVVETKRSGGSMITAEIAYSYNRDVLALPGRYNSASSAGCNLLIKSMKAALVEGPKDLEYALGWKVNKAVKPVQKSLMLSLTAPQQEIVDQLMEKEKISADELCGVLQKPISSIATELFTLELEGIVKALPGKQFTLA